MRMVLERSAQMLSIALANLTFWSAGPVETSELWRKVAMGCAAAASLFFVSSVGRRLVVVIAAPAVILLLALNTRRVEMPADEVLSSGRYYYFPTLAWCALAGAITQSVRARFAGLPVGGIPATLAAAVILGGFAWHQNLVASNALAQFHDLWGTRIAQFQANVALLDRLARSEDGEGIVLPDIPVVVPSVEQHYYPLSVLAEISGSIRPSGGGGKRWEIRQVDSLTPDEIQAAQETFRATGQSLGIEWARTTARFAEDMKAVVWLEARAREQGDIVAVPPISLWYPARNGAEGTSPPLSECVRFGLSTPTPHLAFSRTTENGKRLRSLLAGFDNDEAATWKRWLSGDADSRTP